MVELLILIRMRVNDFLCERISNDHTIQMSNILMKNNDKVRFYDTMSAQYVRVNIQHHNQYHMDYGTCTLTYIHIRRQKKSIYIPAMIKFDYAIYKNL